MSLRSYALSTGVVAVSSMEYGLFLLKPDFEAMATAVADNAGLRDPYEGERNYFKKILFYGDS